MQILKSLSDSNDYLMLDLASQKFFFSYLTVNHINKMSSGANFF